MGAPAEWVEKAVGAVVIAGLVGLAVYWALGMDESPQGAPCPRQHPLDNRIKAPKNVASLEPEAQGLDIAFWRSRAPKKRKFFFGVPEQSRTSLPPIQELIEVRKRPLMREEMDAIIDVDQYVANLRVTSSRQVTLTVCIDPQAHDVDPGTYRGTVVSDDPRIENVTVPISATLQYPRWRWVAFSLGVLVLLTGSIFVWSSTKTGGDGEQVGIEKLLPWARTNGIAVGIGAVAAASVFTASYLRDPAWGASAPSDWFTLIAAMFTAFTAGLTGGRASLQVGSNKQRRRRRRQRDLVEGVNGHARDHR